jgi:type IV fimbrial biogenesis protein FimT
MQARGFTLLEAMIVIALVAVVASLALPSFSGAAERARLKSAAESLASDLAEARFESAQRGRALHVEITPGLAWCWSVATQPGCGCGAAPCRLKATLAGEHAGIAIAEAHSAQFQPVGTAVAGAGAVFESTRGEQLKVELSALGRARLCAPGGRLTGYPAC